MIQSLNGKKVLVLVSNGVDEKAVSIVQRDLLKAGATIKTVGTEPGLINSWNGKDWGIYFAVDTQISAILGSDFDMMVVPSGERSVAKLSVNPHCERIVSSFVSIQKPVCLMGNAVELLDKTGNSAAAEWVMSGDCSGDVESFVAKMVEYFAGSAETELKIAA